MKKTKRQYYGKELYLRGVLSFLGVLFFIGVFAFLSKRAYENSKYKIITTEDGHQYLRTPTNTIHSEGCSHESHKTIDYEN